MNIGARIRQCRELLQLSKTELAEKADLTPAAITQFEDEERVPSAESLKKLSDALEVTADHLLGQVKDADFLKDPRMEALFRGIKKLDPEDIKIMQGLYQMLLEKKKGQQRKESSTS